jgi:hypothetical protein
MTWPNMSNNPDGAGIYLAWWLRAGLGLEVPANPFSQARCDSRFGQSTAVPECPGAGVFPAPPNPQPPHLPASPLFVPTKRCCGCASSRNEGMSHGIYYLGEACMLPRTGNSNSAKNMRSDADPRVQVPLRPGAACHTNRDAEWSDALRVVCAGAGAEGLSPPVYI